MRNIHKYCDESSKVNKNFTHLHSPNFSKKSPKVAPMALSPYKKSPFSSPAINQKPSIFADQYLNSQQDFWNPISEARHKDFADKTDLEIDLTNVDGFFYEIIDDNEEKDQLRPIYIKPRSEHIFIYKEDDCHKLEGFFNINFCKLDMLFLELETTDHQTGETCIEEVYGIELRKGD